MNNKTISRRLIALIVFIMIVVIGVIIFLLVHSGAQKPHTVRINNLDTCTKKINSSVRDNIERETYNLVKSANDYNKTSTAEKYEAVIRDNTCKQEADHSTKGFNGKKQTVKTSSFTLDIPSAKQSWKLSFDWVTGSKVDIDLGSIKPECLPQSQLQYGQFNCEKIMSLAKYGTDKYDPILEYMPYTGRGFELFYDPETKTVKAQLQVPQKDLNNTELIENTKYSVTYWFQHRNLDPKNYKIVYEVVPRDTTSAE